jgi:hypothetical protein
MVGIVETVEAEGIKGIERLKTLEGRVETNGGGIKLDEVTKSDNIELQLSPIINSIIKRIYIYICFFLFII